MQSFKPVTKQDAPKLRRYYQNCSYGLCEYSVGTKLMWRKTLHPAWAEIAGCLVIRNTIDGQTAFDYPVPGPEGDEDAALAAIEAYCLEKGVSPVISVVPECRAAKLLARYPYVRVSSIRTWRDYVYYREDLQFFTGRRYSGQRNHIKKFRTQWPEARFRSLTAAEAAMKEHPSISLVLDIHRDAVSDADGTPYKVVSNVAGVNAAQMSFIIGTDGGGLEHDGWQENLKLASALQQRLLDRFPTLMRPISVRNSRYNQHLTPGALLVEMGAAGNSLDEALLSARLLGQAIAQTFQMEETG